MVAAKSRALKNYPTLAHRLLPAHTLMNAKALCAIVVPIVAVGGFCLRPQSQTAVNSPSLSKAAIVALAAASAMSSHNEVLAEATRTESVNSEVVEIQTAIHQGRIKAEFKANGRETLNATLSNGGTTPLKVRAEVGLVLESGRNAIVVVRPLEVEIEAGKTAEATFLTAATRSSNHVEELIYQITANHVPRIELFLTYIQEHLELSPAAIQTAILALNENLPLSSVAKFTAAGSELKSRFNTDAFRVETHDIITGLVALRDMGVSDAAVAMTVDPQLRIEAMIEPLCRPVAMNYYGITPENEWSFWRNELLSGEPSTRHYALYGIARFYPEIAVEMLPKWARETKTSSVFRLAALQALAETQKPEAVAILNLLAEELGRETELGRAAAGAALALDQRLAQIASVRSSTVAFRASSAVTRF